MAGRQFDAVGAQLVEEIGPEAGRLRGVAGFILPGDYVDVVLIAEDSPPRRVPTIAEVGGPTGVPLRSFASDGWLSIG
jgi:hypothetical protein